MDESLEETYGFERIKKENAFRAEMRTYKEGVYERFSKKSSEGEKLKRLENREEIKSIAQ